MSTQIHLPLNYLKQFMPTKDYRRMKYLLTLWLEVEQNGNQGWTLETLAKLLQHQTLTMKDKVLPWLDEGWLSVDSTLSSPVYYLTPLPQGLALTVSRDTLLQLFKQGRQLECYAWLWLQLHPTTEILQTHLMKALHIDNQEALWRLLRELEWHEIIEVERLAFESDWLCELDYEMGTRQRVNMLVPPYQPISVRAVSEWLLLPAELADWLPLQHDFVPIKAYCEWYLFAEQRPPFAYSLNELIQNVFSIRNYGVMTRHLQTMHTMGMVELRSFTIKRYRLVFESKRAPIRVNRAQFEQAVTTLKPKEFCLWLSLQLYPTRSLTLPLLMRRLAFENPIQARNVLNRLAQTEWIQLERPTKNEMRLCYATIAAE